jgi:hypothetical protein
MHRGILYCTNVYILLSLVMSGYIFGECVGLTFSTIEGCQ